MTEAIRRSPSYSKPHFVYIERPNELLLDYDIPYSEWLRINRRIYWPSRALIRFIEHRRSASGNTHVRILLKKRLGVLQRFQARIKLSSDLDREIWCLGRVHFGCEAPVLLISPHRWPERKPDQVCKCPSYNNLKICEWVSATQVKSTYSPLSYPIP